MAHQATAWRLDGKIADFLCQEKQYVNLKGKRPQKSLFLFSAVHSNFTAIRQSQTMWGFFVCQIQNQTDIVIGLRPESSTATLSTWLLLGSLNFASGASGFTC